jgi:glutaredoxin-related protein
MDEGEHHTMRQNCLRAVTGQRTVPIIYVGLDHIGGYEKLMEKLTDGKDTFAKLLDENGIYHSFKEYEQPFDEQSLV